MVLIFSHACVRAILRIVGDDDCDDVSLSHIAMTTCLGLAAAAAAASYLFQRGVLLATTRKRARAREMVCRVCAGVC